MDGEEIRKAIDFLLGQQAQFAADVQQMRETQAELASAASQFREQSEERMTRNEESLLRLTNIIERVVQTQEKLADALATTDSRIAEAGSRLSTLITVVERYISEERGRQQAE